MQHIHMRGSWLVAGSCTFRSHLTIARGCPLQSFCGRLSAMACARCMGRELSVGVLFSVVLLTMPAMVSAQPLLYGFGFFVCFASGVLFAIFSLLAFIVFMTWLGVRADLAVHWRGQRIQILIAAPSEQQISIPNNERELQDTASDIGSGAGGSSDTALRRRSGPLNASMAAVAESDTPISVSAPPAAAEASSISVVGSISCPRCGRSPMGPRRSQIGDNFYGCASFPDCRGTRPSAGSI